MSKLEPQNEAGKEQVGNGTHTVDVDAHAQWEWEKYSERPHGCFVTGMQGGVFQHFRPDLDQSNVIQYEKINDRSCWLRVPRIFIRLNPIVSLIAVCAIWGFVIWCMLDTDYANEVFEDLKIGITRKFTWLYIGSQDFWALFMIALYFSKYGKVKMGKDDEEPEFSDATWFTMLFACGVGIGLFFYGVGEPVFHYTTPNRYYADAYMPDNELAQWAINLTFFHWGLHAWIVYCIVGMLMGIVSYRMGLPMNVKSCFYPLIGDKIFGWIGDVIDVTSIITTLFGVCTSLGLGVIQLNTGVNILNPDIEVNSTNQIIIIWIITAMATASTLSGLKLGIRRLSELCFGVGMVLMMLVFFLTNTWYILNLYVQSLGFYFQYIIQLGFHCDTFEMLGPATGGEDRGRDFEDGSSDGPEDWMNDWTIFYWGWWIAWSPFVGMFIAKISRGRTLREFINGTMTAPMIYSFLWMSIFGGVGIKMEREAAGVGLCCTHNFYNYSVLQTINSTEYPDITINNGSFLCDGDCNRCSNNILHLEADVYDNIETDTFVEHMDDSQYRSYGIQLPNKTLSRLSCRTSEFMWFDVMQSFGGLGDFLHVFSLIGLVLYFVTSSDSGSYVIDCLAANGDNEPPRIQRVFWAFTEGATATALLYVGEEKALNALQSVAVASGLPYTFVLCFMCISLWRCLAADGGDLNPYGPQFAVGCMDVLSRPDLRSVGKCLLNIFIAPCSFAKTIVHTSDTSSQERPWFIFYSISLYCLYFGSIICFACTAVVDEMWALGWVFYLAFSCAGGAARIGLRNKYRINGNAVEDLFTGILLYPILGYQLSETVDERSRTATTESTYGPRERRKHFEMEMAVGGANNEAYTTENESPPPEYGQDEQQTKGELSYIEEKL